MHHVSPKLCACAALLAACSLATADEPATNDEPVLLAAAAGQPATATVQCADDPALTPQQRRVLDHYDQGVGSLVRYVWISRSTLQLDARETAQWAQAYRASHPAC